MWLNVCDDLDQLGGKVGGLTDHPPPERQKAANPSKIMLLEQSFSCPVLVQFLSKDAAWGGMIAYSDSNGTEEVKAKSKDIQMSTLFPE